MNRLADVAIRKLALRKEASMFTTVADAFRGGVLMRRLRKALRNGPSDQLYDFAEGFSKIRRPGTVSVMDAIVNIGDLTGVPRWKSVPMSLISAPAAFAGSHPAIATSIGALGIGASMLGGDDDNQVESQE